MTLAIVGALFVWSLFNLSRAPRDIRAAMLRRISDNR